MGQRLATLSSLQTLRAHLELPESMFEHRRVPPDHRVNFAGLRQTAAILRKELPQPGLGLWLLRREGLGASWRLFRPLVKQDLEVELYLQEEFDPAGGQVSTAVLFTQLLLIIYNNIGNTGIRSSLKIAHVYGTVDISTKPQGRGVLNSAGDEDVRSTCSTMEPQATVQSRTSNRDQQCHRHILRVLPRPH